MKEIETPRLALRRLSSEDATFILRQVNEPSFLRFIGDRGVRSLEDAREYILKGPIASYERFGFGLCRVELKSAGATIGMCGLVKRDSLEDIDVGFAFLPEYWGNGYAVESVSAVMEHARDVLGLRRLVAITSIDNAGSLAVLKKGGFEFERLITLPGDTEAINLLAVSL